MKKKLVFIALTLSLLILISACGRRGGGDLGGAPRVPFLGGTAGLYIDFVKGSPPEEITDGGTFPFNAVVRIRNDGEFDLRRDQVTIDLIGIFPESFDTSMEELTDKRPLDDLNGRRKDAEGNILEGVTTYVSFPNEVEFLTYVDYLEGNQEFTFRAEVCYFYETTGVADLCVLRDLINVRDEVVCDPSLYKTIHSSSAPVQVVNFKENVLGQDKIGFSFDVVHRRNGIIFKGASADARDGECPKDARARRTKEDRVRVTVDTGLGNVRCNGLDGGYTGHIILSEGRRTVTCIQELDPNRNDFVTPLNVFLEYNYLDDTETRVLVKHLLDSP